MKPFHTSIKVLPVDDCKAILSRNSFCHLGCSNEYETYVVPMTYVFDEGQIYCHSREGKKLEMLRQKRMSCVQVEEVDDFYNWKSVNAFCEFHELTGDEIPRAMRLIINRLKHSKRFPPLEEDFASLFESAVVFRLSIIRLDGRTELRAST